MTFDNWCDQQFVDREGREGFKDFLVAKNIDISILRTNSEWWELWFTFTTELRKKG